MTERIGHGWVRTPSGRIREMTDREIDRFSDEMEAFAERYQAALDWLPADERGAAYTHGNAMTLAELTEGRPQ